MLVLKNYINLYTHPSQSYQIITIIKKFVDKNKIIIDANSGMGGDSIFFCKYFKFIYCIEVNLNCIDYLEHNLKEFSNKEIFNINCVEALKLLNYNCIYFDPPWGGKNYKLKSSIDLFITYNNKKINILNLIDDLYFYSEYIFIKVPINFNKIKLKKLLWKHESFPIYKFFNHQSKIIFNLIVFFK